MTTVERGFVGRVGVVGAVVILCALVLAAPLKAENEIVRDDEGMLYICHSFGVVKITPFRDIVWSAQMAATEAVDMAFDAAGNLVVVGFADSSNFPTTEDAFDREQHGDFDAFVTVLDSSSGELIYSTRIGGSSYDLATDVEVNDAGDIFVVGVTASRDFPTTESAFKPEYTPSENETFVLRLRRDAEEQLVYSTFLGGNRRDGHGTGNYWFLMLDLNMALSDGDLVTLSGYTASQDFPVTENASQQVYGGGGRDVFVTRLRADASVPVDAQLEASTFLGGSQNEISNAVGVLPDGDVVVVGSSYSTDFPSTQDLRNYTGAASTADVYVARFSPDLAVLRESSILGSRSTDRAWTAAIRDDGTVVLGGRDWGGNYWDEAGLFVRNPGPSSAFVAFFDPAAPEVSLRTYIGGGCEEAIWGFATTPAGGVWACGWSCSTDLPWPKLPNPSCFVSLYDPPRAVTAVLSTSQTSGTAPLTLTLSGADSTTLGDTQLTSYEWVVGGEPVGSGVVLEHTIVDPGRYAVELRVTNDVGNTASTVGYVDVLPADEGLEPWISLDRNDVDFPGGAQRAGESCFSLSAADRLWYRELTGDASITVHLSDISSDLRSYFSLVIGEGVQEFERFVELRYRSGTPARLDARVRVEGTRTDREPIEDADGETPVPPDLWLRLDRAGDTVTSHVSTDGQEFQEVARNTIAGLGDDPQAPAVVGFYLDAIRTPRAGFPFDPAEALVCEIELLESEASPWFVRGDSNADGKVEISDAIFTFSHLFADGDEPGCLEAADVDDNGVLQLTDGIATLQYLLFGGAAPAAPFPDCGPDPAAAEGLGCETTTDCAGG